MMRQAVLLFLCGAFGGVSPSLVELASLARVSQYPGKGYFVAMLIFAVIGGGIAIVYQERVHHKAFMLGVAAPALIVAAGAAIDRGGAQDFASALGSLALPWNSAYAELTDTPGDTGGGVPPVPTEPDSTMTTKSLHVQWKNGQPMSPYSLEFFNSTLPQADDQKPILKLGTNEPNAILHFPSNAGSLSLTRTTWRTENIPLPVEGESFRLTITAQETFLSGFLRAFGMEASSAKAKRIVFSVEALDSSGAVLKESERVLRPQ